MSEPQAVYEAVRDAGADVLIGNEEILEGLTIALLTRGHVLLEGVPGVAKTTIANLFARATDLEYSRVQMTPDILPADITGTHVYQESTGEFTLQKGPVFANLVVADKINRATPKTQSALLEAMQERSVTIEGETRPLPEPFMVVATQNPIEMEGTFELPEAQLDRFQLKFQVSLPDRDDERELFDRFNTDPNLGPETVESAVSHDDLLDARDAVKDVFVADPVREYILDIVAASRDSADVEHGGSPRATLAFLNAGKARAAVHGREYVIPDDVKALARPILAHRLILSADAELSGRHVDAVLDDLLGRVDPPSGLAQAELADGTTPEAADD
jgi:MoxR-like ATPase